MNDYTLIDTPAPIGTPVVMTRGERSFRGRTGVIAGAPSLDYIPVVMDDDGTTWQVFGAWMRAA